MIIVFILMNFMHKEVAAMEGEITYWPVLVVNGLNKLMVTNLWRAI